MGRWKKGFFFFEKNHDHLKAKCHFQIFVNSFFSVFEPLLWLFGGLCAKCPFYNKKKYFQIKIHGQIFSQSWPLLNPFYSGPIVQWWPLERVREGRTGLEQIWCDGYYFDGEWRRRLMIILWTSMLSKPNQSNAKLRNANLSSVWRQTLERVKWDQIWCDGYYFDGEWRPRLMILGR